MSQLQVSALNVYPVKSCAGLSVEQVDLDGFGPTGDRRWMIVDEQGQFVTQRDYPRMALIKVEITEQGIVLDRGTERLTVVCPGLGVERTVRVWRDEVVARDAGEDAAAWLSDFFGREVRLVYLPDEGRRAVDPAFASAGEQVAFADGFPLLLIGQASLDDLNRRLEQPVPMNRFRPNLVISGAEPFAEDGWRRLRVGEVELRVVKPCSRCVIPSIVQETAERDRHINRALAGFRRREGVIYFGQNLLYQQPGTLRVGDPVTVLD